MSSVLKGMRIAVLGGDDRELYLVPSLCRMGAEVRTVGLPLQAGDRVKVCDNIVDALSDAQAVILPMPGTDAAGRIRAVYADKPLILTDEVLQRVPRDTLIFIGSARAYLKDAATIRGFKVIEIADIDEVAILNSIPSAEGALQMAMEASPVTVHGSISIVLGMGRCGFTLARMLSALGAKTAVAARKAADLARAYEMGWQPLTYCDLPDWAGKADFIFNTVPAMVVNRDLLKATNPGACIIDLASAPGGVDFEAAAEFGIKAELAPGLPGKVAPKTAGQILAKVIPRLIAQELGLNSAGSKV